MSKIISLVLILSSFNFAFAECKEGSDNHKVASVTDTKDKTVIKVAGMTCQSCVNHLNDEIAKIELPTKTMKIVVKKNLVTILYGSEKVEAEKLATLKATIEKVITDASYKVVGSTAKKS